MSFIAKVYMVIVDVGGLTGLAYGLFGLLQLEAIWVLLLLTLLCGVAQAMSVPLFSSSSVSLAFAISFLSLLLFGPAGAIIANLGSAIVHAFYPTRRAWYKSVFNASVFTVSAAAAGMVYSLAGGDWPVRDLMSAAVPAALAATVYFFVNTGLISLIVSLTIKADFFRVFNENHRWLILHYLTIATISLMAAIGYESMGFAGLAALLLPLLMPWASTRMYVAQTNTVNARNSQLIEVNTKLGDTNSSLQQRIEEMLTLYRVGLALNRSIELTEKLTFLVQSVRELTQAHYVAIFLYEKDNRRFRLGGQVGLYHEHTKLQELSLDGPAVRALSEGRRILLDGDSTNQDFLSSIAASEGIVAAACLPLTVAGEVVGALDITYVMPHVFSANELTMLETFAEQAATSIYSARLYQQVHSTYLSTIAVLVAMVEAKDPNTRGHSERVRDFAVSIGIQMVLSPEDLNTLELAALFHDIGKVSIPENILGKNGPLTEEEWLLVKRHPELAANILRHVPSLAATIPVIRAHHERVDGKGYPDRLEGEIPKLSAIIAVADSYDAMMSDRPYRKALYREHVVAELQAGAGTQFDPEVVEAFLQVIQPKDEPRLLFQGRKLELIHGEIT